MAGKFFSTLRDLRAGSTLDDLDSAIAEVVSAVKATHKTGEITLKLKIRPPKKATATYLTVEDEVTTKVPKHDRADTIFFPLADNSLSRNDPSQLQLGLRPVTSVDPETGEVEFAQSQGQ
jgi:hypothetical protein